MKRPKPKVGDEIAGVWHQGRQHSARVTKVMQKWMIVVLPYHVKMPMANLEESSPGRWRNSYGKLTYQQAGKAYTYKRENYVYIYTCRYCDHRYTGAGIHSHKEVDEHLVEHHPEQYLDLLGGGDG
jgi:hypothetical protein